MSDINVTLGQLSSIDVNLQNITVLTDATGNFVPYTGATTDVDLGANSVKAEVFKTDVLYTRTGTEPVGSLYWHETDGTLDIVLKNGTILQAGQELHFYGKASGSIANGDAVQFAGVQGDHILIKKAVASEINAFPQYLLGVATQNISNGVFGYCTGFGKINGIYTNTPNNNDSQNWVAGDRLWFNFATGQLTNTQPQAPTRNILVGYVVKTQTGNSENGIIFVDPKVGFKLTDLDDVDGTPLTTTGQILVWDNARQVFDFTDNISSYKKVSTGSGAPVTSPVDGTMHVDTSNHRLYVRSGGAWRYINLI